MFLFRSPLAWFYAVTFRWSPFVCESDHNAVAIVLGLMLRTTPRGGGGDGMSVDHPGWRRAGLAIIFLEVTLLVSG